MSLHVAYTEADVCSFVEALGQLSDDGDNRGQRHAFAFVVAAVVLAILRGPSKVSSIFRYIRNRLACLQEVTQFPEASAISRAHWPRLLARLDSAELNGLIDTHFGVRVALRAHHGWVAIDGQTLRGRLASGAKQSVVLAVRHEGRTLLAQAPMRGSKASDITVVRDLLKASSLERHKVTLDAPHCNPETTAQIHQAGGQYLIHIKANQPILLKQCQDFAVTAEPLSRPTQSDKGQGRLTTREAQGFDISGLNLAARWRERGIQSLVVMKRQTEMLAKQKTTWETASYMSNQELASDPPGQAQELTGAIRAHWHVASDNWIPEVTFEEDHVKTHSANQAQVMSSLRSLAIR